MNQAWRQIVAGTNYRLSLTGSNGQNVVVVIYVPLGDNPVAVLSSVEV